MKNLLYILPFFLIGCKSLQAQPPQNGGGIGTVKTEQYQAEFEKKQSIDVVSDYDGSVQVPIQLLKIGINEELYEMYPELKDKRVGLGVTNIVIEYLEYTNRFIFTEEKEDIKQRMIAQDKASDKGISSNKIDVKGNVVLAKYFVYIEVYDFSVSEDEIVKVNGQINPAKSVKSTESQMDTWKISQLRKRKTQFSQTFIIFNCQQELLILLFFRFINICSTQK